MYKRLLALILCVAFVFSMTPAVNALPIRVEQQSEDRCCQTLRVNPLDANYVRPDYDGYLIDITPQRVADTFAYLDEHYVKNYPEQALNVYTGTEEDRENLLTLAQTITKGCATDKQKADAIGSWLSRNINYDVNTSAYASDTFYRREGNCLSYANLMMFLLRSLGIPAVVGDGWRGDMKTSTVELFNFEGHAWCFVYLNGQWVLYDPLWIEGGTTDREYMAEWIYFDTVEFVTPVTDGDNLPPRTNELPMPYWTNGNYYLYSNAFPTGSGTLSYFVNNQAYIFVSNQCEPEGSQDGRLYIDGRDKSDMVMGELYRDGWVSYGEYHNNRSMAHTYAFPNGMMPDGYTMEFDDKLWYMSYDAAMPILMDEGDYWIQDGLVTMAPGYSGPWLGLRWQDGCFESSIGEVFLEYENCTPEVATIDDSGNITCHAEGYAEFRYMLQRRDRNGNITLMGSAITSVLVSNEDRTPDYRDLGNHTHDMVYSHGTEATCESWGIDIYRCSGCVYTEEYYVTEPLGHDHRAVDTTEPTCTDYGYVIYECSRCGDSYSAAEIDMLEHDYIRSILTGPTCTEEGVSYYQCSRCLDEEVKVDIPALGHAYVNGICTRCGEANGNMITGTCGDQLTWSLSDDGTLTITGTGDMYNYEYMEAPWCGYLENIRHVVILDGVTRIGNNAFRDIVNITDVSLSDTVIQIGSWSFMGLEKLTAITLPQNLMTLEQEAFRNCVSLEAIELPGTLTFIDGPFSGCTSLTRAVIHAAPNAPSLVMGNGPFRFCKSLETIEVDENHFCLKAIDGVLYSYSDWGMLLIQYPCGKGDTVFQIPQGTYEIFQLAMEDVDALEELIIPDSVRAIGSFALMSCDNLHTIRFMGDAPEFMEDVFRGVTAAVYYPAGNDTWTEDVMQNYAGNLVWIPYEVEAESIASGACGDNLTWVLTDDGTLTISGTGDMYDYTTSGPWQEYQQELLRVIIRAGVTSIGSRAFSYCSNMTDISIPNSVTEIGERAMECCYELREIIFPNDLKTIGEAAFMSCISLSSVFISDSVEYIGDLAFWGCKPIPNYEITAIHTNGEPVDYQYVGIREVRIGRNVSYIGSEAFSNCTMLEGLYVDENNPFYSSDSRGVLFNKDKTILVQAPGALSGHYEIPGTVKTIGQWGLGICPNLTGVTIPASVEKIEDYAFCAVPTISFEYSTSLTEIRFEGDVPQMGVGVFEGLEATVSYPEGNDTWNEEVLKDYGGEIVWKEERMNYVKFTTYTTSLGGNIAMNFYVELSDDLVNDPNAYMQFTFAGKTVKVPLSEGKKSGSSYQFSCPITSKNMSDDITAQVYNAYGTVGGSKTMAVDTYCNWVIGAYANDAKTVNLMKAMLNYGASAQMLFDHNTDDLANTDLVEEDKILSAVDASAYLHSRTGEEEGIKPNTYTLLLDSETTIRVYFQLTGDKTIDEYTFTVDGVEVKPQKKDGLWYIEKTNIAAHRLDDMHVFTCGDITIHYGGLSYVNQVMTYYKSGTTFDMAVALYNYSQAAEAYIA